VNWVDYKDFREDLLKSKGFFHFSFWVMFYFFMVLIDKTEYPIWFILIDKLMDISFYILIVYINILYLIPNILQKRNLVYYVLSIIVLVLLVTPIQTLSTIILYQDNPEFVSDILNNRIIIFLSLLLVGLTSTGYKVTTDWLGLQNEKRELQSQNLQSELKFLKSQINPHFFFNTLNNLYALTLKKSDLAPEIVLRLSEMMRYMLYESNEKEVSLEKEINYVINYIELEKLRQGERFQINFDIQGKPQQQRIAPLMFIPFLENSFKHGLDSHIKAGYVNAQLTLDDASVSLDIKNSKPKNVLQPINGSKSGGIGLENVKRRLKLLYPNKHILEINDANDFYHVALEINLT